jgi:hypothetical protein
MDKTCASKVEHGLYGHSTLNGMMTATWPRASAAGACSGGSDIELGSTTVQSHKGTNVTVMWQQHSVAAERQRQ